jgi:hypothetical protein
VGDGYGVRRGECVTARAQHAHSFLSLPRHTYTACCH